jgi:(1->4)-alpha-D-glucan 1-alpha-D-glucosylmutase
VPDLTAAGLAAMPGSTYRLQLRPEFGFAAAAGLAGYLSGLGVTHAYLSPILQAAPGSQHGYDVTDHAKISADLGGEDEFRRMAARFASHDIGIVADVVPNHMGIPAPEYLNRPLWSVLRDGQNSPRAHWFDIDWTAGGGQLLLPILARPLQHCLQDIRLSTLSEVAGAAVTDELSDASQDLPVLCYQGHVLPVQPGTERLPLAELLATQAYRLDSWRAAATDLNWRRFFDISSLIAVRVEEPDVFAATHGLLLGLVAEGLIQGLRIDHPDGLADPLRYLRQLATAAGGAWIVAEKILAAGEELPPDWACAGTTGYDSLAAVGGLFTEADSLTELADEYLRFAGGPADFAAAAWAARREAAGQSLNAEVARLARLARQAGDPVLTGVPPDEVRMILAELLAAFTVYRAYVVPGQAPSAVSATQVGAAAAMARRRLPARLHPAADLAAALLLGRSVPAGRRPARDDLMIRFQQTCAAVQAKGVEDTAAYRWTRLVSANEVGCDPDLPATSPADFHRYAIAMSENWPASMTTLSTHDTKRQEDVRARIAVLADRPREWISAVTEWHGRAAMLTRTAPDPPTEYLFWQTVVGAWPVSDERLTGYLRKAMREAKLSTSWTEPDSRYEAAVISFARRALADERIASGIEDFVRRIGPDAQAAALGAKLVQLTMPGIPDVYQGCELGGLSLVDPDNRRPVDYDRRRVLLAAADEGMLGPGPELSLDAAKLLITSRALRLRRDHPDWFAGDYQPLPVAGQAAAHAVAFCRAGHVITVATRLPGGLRRKGGWQDTTVTVPPGRWRDLLTGIEHVTGGADGGGPAEDRLAAAYVADRGAGWLPLAGLTTELPVALLIPAGVPATGRLATQA